MDLLNLNMTLHLASSPQAGFDPKTSNAIPVNSITEGYNRIKTFLEEGPCDEDLLLKIPGVVYISPPVQHLLKLARRTRRRLEFDPDFEILKIKAMPRPLHDAIQNLMMPFALAAGLSGFLRYDEFHHIHSGIHQTYSSDQRSLDFGQRSQGLEKYPDTGIGFAVDLIDKVRYRVVFEVGLSQSYDDLIRDIFQWLHRSDDPAKVAVLTKITENKRELKRIQSTEAFKSRRRDLLSRFGNATSRERYLVEEVGDESTSPDSIPDWFPDTTSDTSAVDESGIRAAIVASDWLGPISVFLEMWILKDGFPVLREPRVVSSTFLFNEYN